MKNKIRILGLDLALNSTGFAVVDIDKKTFEISIERIGNTNTTSKENWGEKYKIIYRQMVYFRDKVSPDLVIIERPFMQHGNSTMAIMGALGVVRLVFAGMEPLFISANTIKKEIAGHGHAKKHLVKAGLLKMFPNIEFQNDDESDALGVVITHLIKEGKI